MSAFPRRSALVLFAAAAIALGACSRVPQAFRPIATAASRPPSATISADPPATPTPPAATPVPFGVALILDDAADLAAPVRVEVEALAAANGWQPSVGTPEAMEAVLARGADAIVAVGDGAPRWLSELRANHSEVPIVLVGLEAPASAGGQIIRLGGPDSRHDQAGFLAGALAGWVTESQTVAIAGEWSTVAGRRYGNGFLHGMRYSCAGCELHEWLLSGAASDEALVAGADRLAASGVDVAFVMPVEAEAAALRALADRGLWVIGSGQAGGAAGERALGDVAFRPDRLLRRILPQLAAGERPAADWPYDLAGDAIGLTPPYPDRVSPAVQARMDEMIVALSAGSLDTGVDPATGEVR